MSAVDCVSAVFDPDDLIACLTVGHLKGTGSGMMRL